MDRREGIGYEAEQTAEHLSRYQDLNPWEDLLQYLREYSRERPEVVAITCLSIGFILGWKLKPW